MTARQPVTERADRQRGASAVHLPLSVTVSSVSPSWCCLCHRGETDGDRQAAAMLRLPCLHRRPAECLAGDRLHGGSGGFDVGGLMWRPLMREAA